MGFQVAEDAVQSFFGTRAEEPSAGADVAAELCPGLTELPCVWPSLGIPCLAIVGIIVAVLDGEIAMVS